MKLFHDERDGRPLADPAEADAIARLAIETGVRLIRIVKRAVRTSPTTATVSLSGLRTLAYLADSPGGCLSDVAEHLLVGNPTASKVVDDLVERGLLERVADSSDRRKLALTATKAGKHLVTTAAQPAQEQIAERLSRLTPGERESVRAGLQLLHEQLEGADLEVTEGRRCSGCSDWWCSGRRRSRRKHPIR